MFKNCKYVDKNSNVEKKITISNTKLINVKIFFKTNFKNHLNHSEILKNKLLKIKATKTINNKSDNKDIHKFKKDISQIYLKIFKNSRLNFDIRLSKYKIGITETHQAIIQKKNLFLFKGSLLIYEKIYHQKRIGKNVIIAKNII